MAIGARPPDSTVARDRPAIRRPLAVASDAGDCPVGADERKSRLLVVVEVHDLRPFRRLMAARAIRASVPCEPPCVRILVAPAAGGGPSGECDRAASAGMAASAGQ